MAVATTMSYLSDIIDDVIFAAIDLLPLEPWQRDVILDDVIGQFDLTNDSSSGCRECVAANRVLVRLIAEEGLKFEDLRDLAIDICYNVTELEGWDGSLICEGVVDNYGPHVVHIFNTSIMSPEEMCLTLNECKPDEIEPEEENVGQDASIKTDVKVQGRPYVPRRKLSSADYEGALKVVHITDIHNEPYYDVGSDNVCSMPMCCRDEWPGTGYAGPWGAYYCNIPLQTTDLYLDFIKDLKPDIVLHTGDTPPNTVWLETLQFQINMSKVFADKVRTKLPGIPTYSTLGNHECFPTNLYYPPHPDTAALNEEFGLMWQIQSGFGAEQLATMQTGGYYSVLVKPGLRVLAYNTNFIATANWYVLLDMMPHGYGAMRQFMVNTFADARVNNEKILLLGHHLSGTGGRLREWSEFVTNLCRQNADIIVLHLFGHSHKDKFQMNTDPVTGDVYDVQISSASMSSSPHMNPNAKMFYLDNSTMEVLDVDTFFLDLQDPSNNGSEPVIRLQYRATVEYDMADFSPASIKDFVDRMETNDTLLTRYLVNVETQSGFEEDCDEKCKKNLFCDLRTTSYNQVEACEDQP